jgi:hypothetical protein
VCMYLPPYDRDVELDFEEFKECLCRAANLINPEEFLRLSVKVEQLMDLLGRVGYHCSPRYFALKTHAIDDSQYDGPCNQSDTRE